MNDAQRPLTAAETSPAAAAQRIVVHKIAPAWGLPSVGPFTLKLEAWLRMVGLPYESVVDATPFRGPKGKLPWIEHEGRVIGDSNFIIDYLGSRYGVDLDRDLTAAQRGCAQGLLRLLEENLYWVMVYSRWFEEANWKIFRPVVLGGLPAPMRMLISVPARRGVRRQLLGHGIGLHSREEIYSIGERDVNAVADVLGDQPYLMGGQATRIDAAAYGLLANILLVPIPSPAREAGLARRNLVDYLERIRGRWFA
jgi:glutathione S-transferase